MNLKSYLFENNIKKLTNDIVLFYGENLGLKNDFKKNIKTSLIDAELINLDQEDIIKNEKKFIEEFLNISLFNEQKIYFINQVNDKLIEFVEYVENKIENQKIFLFAENLEKKSKIRTYFERSKTLGIIACYQDNEIGLKKIILERLANYQGLSPENLNMIISNSNLNRVKLNNELDKIQTYFINKKINKSELAKLLNIDENNDFNLLKDTALSGNLKSTNKLLSDTIIEDDKTIFYINLFNYRLNRINEILAKNEKSVEHVVNTMKPPVFWKDKPKLIEQVKKWDRQRISDILDETYKLELKFKSNANLNKNILIKKLVVDICNQANAS